MAVKQCAFPRCKENGNEGNNKEIHYCSFECYAEHASELKSRMSTGIYEAIIEVFEDRFTEEELNILFRNNVKTIYYIADKMRESAITTMAQYFAH